VAVLDFGEVRVGASRALPLRLANTGGTAATSLPISLIGGGRASFAIGQERLIVGPGQTAALQITFAPTAAGAFSARVQLDFGQSFFETELKGIGAQLLPQLALSATELRFDSTGFDQLPPVDGQETRALTIANAGPGALRLDSLRVLGPHFAAAPGEATVLPGDSLLVSITYAPQGAGLHADTLVVHSDDPERPLLRVPLSGATLGSLGPQLRVETALEIGEAAPGDTARRALAVANTGTHPLHLRPALSGDTAFALESDSLTAMPGAQDSVIVRFAPQAEGEYAGVLLLESDDPLRPAIEVALSGRGTLPLRGEITLDFYLAEGDQGRRRAGSAAPGKTYALQLHLAGASPLTGWGATLEYDPEQVRYVEGSFRASPFIPGLLELVDSLPGRLGVGGTVLEEVSGREGSYTLGTLSFAVQEGFGDSTELVLTEISLRAPGQRNARRQVRAVATLTARALDEPLRADFDGDGAVGFQDFFLFADAFGGTDPFYDLDDSGRVDFIDFFIFADYFGGGRRARLLVLARQHLGLPARSWLEQNFPNPFNVSTALRYWLAGPGPVLLEIFDLQGQKVRTLKEGFQEPGFHQAQWDGADESGRPVAAGLYLGRLETARETLVRKMLLVK
jgi:hypothetical protein